MPRAPLLPRRALCLALCVLFAACASSRGDLDHTLDEQVGKPADDPAGFRVQHAANRVYASRPYRGKVQEEYRIGFRDNCRVFLTLDERTRKIVDWRYVGPDEDCLGSPNVGGSARRAR